MIPETPQIITAPFAYNGDIRNIPATTPLGSNQFSFESGFPVSTQTPLNAGGIPPERIDFNSAFNVLSTFIYYMQSGNHFKWNNQLDYNVGAVVLGSDNALYYCIQANGATSPNTVHDPTTSSDYWTKIIYSNGSINLPVGFIYIQLRNQSTPDVLFGTSGTWQDVSSSYAGEFFRAVGGNSGSFGTTQAEGLPEIYGGILSGENIFKGTSGAFREGTKHYDLPTNASTQTDFNSVEFKASYYNPIYGASTHVTPYNSAIRIWKKIA